MAAASRGETVARVECWGRSAELGYVLSPTAHQKVPLLDWQKPAPHHTAWNLSAWAEHAVGVV